MYLDHLVSRGLLPSLCSTLLYAESRTSRAAYASLLTPASAAEKSLELGVGPRGRKTSLGRLLGTLRWYVPTYLRTYIRRSVSASIVLVTRVEDLETGGRVSLVERASVGMHSSDRVRVTKGFFFFFSFLLSSGSDLESSTRRGSRWLSRGQSWYKLMYTG